MPAFTASLALVRWIAVRTAGTSGYGQAAKCFRPLIAAVFGKDVATWFHR